MSKLDFKHHPSTNFEAVGRLSKSQAQREAEALAEAKKQDVEFLDEAEFAELLSP